MLLSGVLIRLSRTLSCSLLIPALLLAQPSPTPLWPAARYTTADRDSAIDRGMAFIYRQALDTTIFADHGHDLLWCFYTISATAKNPHLRAMARKMGHQYYVDMHVEVDPEMTVQRSHEIAHDVKDKVRTQVPRVRDVLVHIEPSRNNKG